MDEVQPELSRIVKVDGLGPVPERFEVEANAEERAAVAGRLGLRALDRFSAQVVVECPEPGKVRLSGKIQARAVQTCVVSLEPVAAEISEPFDILFAAEESAVPSDEILVEVEEDESPEPLVGGVIDIGEAVTQQLALALDPYPRKSGAVVPGAAADAADSGPQGPFAALASLRKDA